MNCWEPGGEMVGFAGVTAIEVKVGGGFTVSKVLPVTPESAAEMVVVPAATAVADPAALMVATLLLDEVHVTWLVRFFVLLSE